VRYGGDVLARIFGNRADSQLSLMLRGNPTFTRPNPGKSNICQLSNSQVGIAEGAQVESLDL